MVVLNRVRGDKKKEILKAIDSLIARGSTAGGEGIKLAYKIAKENFIKGGNNRVILATDGDFNVGVQSESELVDLIEKEKKGGVYLSILGFGMGNFKDSKMEKLADKGNGNYGYIDNLLEAKKLLVEQMSGTLFTIAKDVKVQVEFNPLLVKRYRLIGYVNRKMADEDFKDDKKDAAEVGAGHRVTVLYELELKDKNSSSTSPLKYQTLTPSKEAKSDEVATVKLRFKTPEANTSKEIQKVVKLDTKEIREEDFLFPQVVAGFGMILRDSQYRGDLTLDKLLEIAKKTKGKDINGYRAEFIRVLQKAKLLKETK
jgi:Ca-activated chloride channel family protein